MEAAATTSVPTLSTKRVPTKAKVPSAAVAKKPAVRKPRTVVKDPPEIVDITSMIAEAAYLIAANRGFAPGHDIEDWLQAEQLILSRYR